LRTLYAFGFLLVTLIGLQVLTGGHRPTRTNAQRVGTSRVVSSAWRGTSLR
jgi:hypothetical protein